MHSHCGLSSVLVNPNYEAQWDRRPSATDHLVPHQTVIARENGIQNPVSNLNGLSGKWRANALGPSATLWSRVWAFW